MRKRLELAGDLLKISGLIMISIDINEIAQLKLLCDEIFSEKNLVANIVWRKTNSPKAQAVGLGNQHEYILIYAKDFSKIKINKRIGEITESYTKMFSQDDKDGRGKYRTIEIEAHGIQNNEKRNRFKFRGRTAPWLYSIKTLENWWNEGKISVSKNGRYRKKEYLSEIKGRLISDLWTDEEIKPLQGSSSEYVNFLTQKPISLIKRAIKLYEPNKGIVLDFFAGSGTTASTVLGLNKDKDFDYQCIICTNNEENICLDYCYPRIKKDLQKFGNSLKYYKTDFIGKNNILDASDEDKVELAHNAGELLALAENTLELVKKNKYYQLFKDNLKEKYTAVYFREELDQFDKFADMVKKLDKETVVYVFSWGQEEFIEEFEDLKNVNVKTIPVPILEIYKNIYNLIT
jgi:adenine-specific DNA-methyltransferase